MCLFSGTAIARALLSSFTVTEIIKISQEFFCQVTINTEVTMSEKQEVITQVNTNYQLQLKLKAFMPPQIL